jgi:hypothetical protein
LALGWIRLLTGGQLVLHVFVNSKFSVDQLWNCYSFKAFLLRPRKNCWNVWKWPFRSR